MKDIAKAQPGELYLFVDKECKKKHILYVLSVKEHITGLNFMRKDPDFETDTIIEYKDFNIITGEIGKDRLWISESKKDKKFTKITEERAYNIILKSEIARSVLRARKWMEVIR